MTTSVILHFNISLSGFHRSYRRRFHEHVILVGYRAIDRIGGHWRDPDFLVHFRVSADIVRNARIIANLSAIQVIAQLLIDSLHIDVELVLCVALFVDDRISKHHWVIWDIRGAYIEQPFLVIVFVFHLLFCLLSFFSLIQATSSSAVTTNISTDSEFNRF
jgi:hypothetical protein